MDMNGALMRASSRFAVAAALGLFVGVSSSQAADLGGNCCADLEERIAELEATTARKGNRKMSLTITGQVHRAVVWYDDGFSQKTYYGLDNTNSSSRFIFAGNAKINPKVSMGFEIMIEIEAGGTSSKVNQFDEDGKVGGQISGSAAPGTSFNQHNLDPYFGDARHVAWWIEHADLGRLTVGRWESAGVLGTIDLTGHIFLPASTGFNLLNGGFFIRGNSGQYYAIQWNNIMDPAANNPGRTEGVRYDSPAWHGFIYSASINEAGDYYGSMIRYANEFNGVRLAGTVGYEVVRDRSTPATLDPTNVAFTGPAPDQEVWGFALSAMHVPTGLFVQGHYNHIDYNAPFNVNSGYWNSGGGATQKPASQWMIQAGISKNFFGPGNTSLYGEYGVEPDWGASSAGRNYGGTGSTATCPGVNGACVPTIANFTTVNGVTETETRMWGMGIVQKFDAAATDMYLGYRHFDAEITCNGTGAGASAAAPCGGAAGAAIKLPTQGIDVIVAGARVLF
jgi:hypothetical protein